VQIQKGQQATPQHLARTTPGAEAEKAAAPAMACWKQWS
jgi:hypothetical protein